MTKAIRVENADNSQHKVRVRVMQKETAFNDGRPDILVREVDISTPTQMETLTIFRGQYLIVEEI